MIRPAALFLIAAGYASSASAFAPPSAFASRTRALTLRASLGGDSSPPSASGSFDPLGLSSSSPDAPSAAGGGGGVAVPAAAGALASASLAWSILPPLAAAAGPDWGIFEGRTGSLLHPLAMGTMFLLSLSTGYLGLQWRRQRELGDEISALKRTLPDLGGASSVGDALAIAAAVEGEGRDEGRIADLRAAVPVSERIAELTAERKELSGQGLRDKHYNQGALLAFIGTAFAIEGPLNTYARAGKLFPGPHLYAGATCVVLWSAAAACVPFMSKGNDTARSLHIAANTVGTALFGWQVLTGWPILLKVVELTKWP